MHEDASPSVRACPICGEPVRPLKALGLDLAGRWTFAVLLASVLLIGKGLSSGVDSVDGVVSSILLFLARVVIAGVLVSPMLMHHGHREAPRSTWHRVLLWCPVLVIPHLCFLDRGGLALLVSAW